MGVGGLLVYVDNNYEFRQIPGWHVCSPDSETLWIKSTLKSTTLTDVEVIYRHPNGNVGNYMDILEQNVLQVLCLHTGDVLVMGFRKYKS